MYILGLHCMYTYMGMCIGMCVSVCMNVCMFVRLSACMYACMHACMHVCSCIFAPVIVFLCSCPKGQSDSLSSEVFQHLHDQRISERLPTEQISHSLYS